MHANDGTSKARPRPADRLDAATVDAWLFDLDNTLYPFHCNLFAQVDQRMMSFIADRFGLGLAEARDLQKRYFRDHGTTLNGLMLHHGLPPAEFLQYVHDIDVSPVPPCPPMDNALERLPGRKFVFTNGSVAHAERVLERRGIARHFEAVFDIVAAEFRPKPDPEIYQVVCDLYGIDPTRAAMVEDIPRNLEPAHALGMTTVLVHSDHPWSEGGDPGPFVDYVVEDLVDWLHELVADMEAAPTASPPHGSTSGTSP